MNKKYHYFTIIIKKRICYKFIILLCYNIRYYNMANALLDNVQKLKGKVPDISGGGKIKTLVIAILFVVVAYLVYLVMFGKS